MYLHAAFHRVDPTHGSAPHNRITLCGDRVPPDVPTLTTAEADQANRGPCERLSSGPTCEACEERLPTIKAQVRRGSGAKPKGPKAGKRHRKRTRRRSVWTASGGLPTLGDGR